MSEALKTEIPRLHPVATTATTQAIQNATSEDTMRASRTIADSMQVIIKGLERELHEAQVVRNRITERIVDLHMSINTARATLESLKNYGA